MKFGFAGAVVIIALAFTSAHAEDGRPSTSKLAGMGLGNLAIATDAQGMEVRGMGGSRSFAAGAFNTTAGTTGSGLLSYAFAVRRNNALSAGDGFSVSQFAQVVNGTSFVFTARAQGSSVGFAP
jgi:hypothetical protein